MSRLLPFGLIALVVTTALGTADAQERVPSQSPSLENGPAHVSSPDLLGEDESDTARLMVLGVPWGFHPRLTCGGAIAPQQIFEWPRRRLPYVAPGDEFVALMTDSLAMSPEVPQAGWEVGRQRVRFVLEDGAVLVLDRHSLPGTYVLDAWRLLEVLRGARGEVRWRMRPRPWRALYFSIFSGRRAGLVVETAGDTTLRNEPEIIEGYFLDRPVPLLSERPRPSGSARLAAEIESDRFPHAGLPMPGRQPRLIRVVWLTFDAALEGRLPALVDAERRWVRVEGDVNRWVHSSTPPSPQALANAHVLGSVLVDLQTGRIVERTGAVR